MKRHTFSIKVKSGKNGEFRKLLGKLWKNIVSILDENNVRNFSLWNAENIVFGYCETDDDSVFAEKHMNQIIEWGKKRCDVFEWISPPTENMRLMYHDFGYIRKNKELIRHRIFITKLSPGKENEYKKRHDELIKARNGELNRGPDSNFTIWYAGGYIFGYDEIDTTMEDILSDAERQKVVAWETKMLEIMSWVTNDVDWITGDYHENIKRIAWHN